MSGTKDTPVSTFRLELNDVTVDFGATRALADVSAQIGPGEIVGLLGHNGAGKSTLFNVLAGVIRASAGSFLLDGEHVPADSTPRDVAELGISILYQEPALAANLTVFENLWLAQPARKDKTDRRRVAEEALGRVGAEFGLDLPVASLTLGERQMVGLARGLLGREIRVLLLDEPTAALGRQETDALHRIIRRLAQSGTTVIYVSHRLPDILSVCERILILSGGRLVADESAASFTPQRLARALAPGLIVAEWEEPRIGEPSLEVTFGSERVTAHRGEVLGLFGMAAGEQFDLVERVFGVRGRATFTLRGRQTRIASPHQAMRRRVHLVPADRERDGLISGMGAAENVFLPWHGLLGRSWWINPRYGATAYETARHELGILGPGGVEPIDEFSGGNRQKHLLARWMSVRTPDVLLLAQPTQGVDVGAKADIARAVRRLAATGATVVVASAESDEIASLCDRAYVLLAGAAREVTRTPDFDEQLLTTLLALAADAPTRQPEGPTR
ncbi:sugar ABC transporter ATP-binding protein [Agromyces endophyticus]|uniref:ATP-binding cassette domain-containing protein n=1 Tax=Agromyces sp. H17E-10 TaxID=2932244 RepID=UPI001FD143B4|nr:sugar ABC transporter ATP-binding protein [Agromyces sp. H17E-10]UOQ89129.1 sugar ABC transporter ATP-binding protein [Agromyces sp. H17E-10]